MAVVEGSLERLEGVTDLPRSFLTGIDAQKVTPGVRVFGAAALALGVVGLIWGDFLSNWQPVPESVPGRRALAWLAAAIFLLGGGAVQARRGGRLGGFALGALYAVFALLWSRRIVGYPHILGVWSGTAEQLALVLGGLAAVILAGGRNLGSRGWIIVCRVSFGVCAVLFGLAHFTALPQTASMVPGWLPFGRTTWAVLTGIFHVLAGLALISGIQALLAARLLTAMFISFGVLVWAPKLISYATDHTAWGGNAINLALIGAAWTLADLIGAFGSAPRDRNAEELGAFGRRESSEVGAAP